MGIRAMDTAIGGMVVLPYTATGTCTPTIRITAATGIGIASDGNIGDSDYRSLIKPRLPPPGQSSSAILLVGQFDCGGGLDSSLAL